MGISEKKRYLPALRNGLVLCRHFTTGVEGKTISRAPPVPLLTLIRPSQGDNSGFPDRTNSSHSMISRVYTGKAIIILLTIFCFTGTLWSQTSENCSNGIDDDGDGLIDCFDQDCACAPGTCDTFYYSTCKTDCFFLPPCDSINLGIQWTSEAETGTYSPLVAGDMDRDGIPEVITYRVDKPDIYIIDGATGKTKYHIIGETVYPGGTAPAIADLDLDGYGELIIIGDDRFLRCYEHDGTLKYRGTVKVGYHPGYNHAIPNIADFDYDGLPEINVGNQVYNGQTGALLAEGGATVSAGEHPARVTNGRLNSFCSPVAIDALPDSFCPDCQGLEIVAGNQVLSVNLATGRVKVEVSAPVFYSDGYTSVADMDRDGDLDAVVQGRKNGFNTVYCWDIQTPTVLRERRLDNNYAEGASRVNIADLNGDGKLEISFVSYPTLYALKNDFSVLWRATTNDASAVTCSSVFDFCGDGSADVIYRGESYLQIIEGASGKVKWQDDCLSATHIENPLVLDVDNDGQTEILIECGANGSRDIGHVIAYEALGTPGIASRKVWNQHAYMNVNINDDLSVPRHQQNPHIVGDSLKLNGFLNQYFNPTFPAPDVDLSLQTVVCDRDSLLVTLRVTNTGEKFVLKTIPISFYRNNPQKTAAQWIGTRASGFDLQPDSSRTFTLKMPRVANDSVYIIFNDDHSIPPPFNLSKDFPSTTVGECDFTDNIVSFLFRYAPPVLNLGADTAICHNGTLALNATGANYIRFQWHDGSTQPTFLAPGPGTYAATVTDVCGITQTDQIVVTIDSSTVVQLGADRVICQGETVALSESGFGYYRWSPATAVNCLTCPSVAAGPAQSGKVVLEAGFNNGCISRDTVFITVHDTFNIRIDSTICYGRTVLWNNLSIQPDKSATRTFQTIHGCDSTVTFRVKGTKLGTYLIQVDTGVCLGSTLTYNSKTFTAGQGETFFLSARSGCDSTVVLKTFAKDTFYTTQDPVICDGDTFNVFGVPRSASGVFQQKFRARNGCDSTHTVRLKVLDPISIAFDATPSCAGEATGVLNVIVNGTAAPFRFQWNHPGNSGRLENLPAGDYALTVTDAKDCTQTANARLTAYPPIVFEARADSARCFGDTNGAIHIQSTDPDLVYSLDAAPFVQTKQFDQLGAATYMLRVEDTYGCVDTLQIKIGEPPRLTVRLPEDTGIRLGDSLPVRLITTAIRPLQYQWADTSFIHGCTNCLTPVLRPVRNHTFSLQVTDTQGCTASDEIRIEVARIVDVFVGNALAPDSDANGRLWPAFGPAVRVVRRFAVYDRWGTLVYEQKNTLPDDNSGAWEGRYRGKMVDTGVYIWAMEVELWDGTSERLRGDVTVLK